MLFSAKWKTHRFLFYIQTFNSKRICLFDQYCPALYFIGSNLDFGLDEP